MTSFSLVKNLPNPRERGGLHGWFVWHQQFKQLLNHYRPHVCAEIGVWTGSSAIFTLETIKPWGGVLYAVDSWNGFDPLKGLDATSQEVAKTAYERFLTNIYDHQLEDRTYVIKASGQEVTFPQKLSWLYLDSSHEYQDTIETLRNIYPFIQSKGVILGDDYLLPEVFTAWQVFIKEFNLPKPQREGQLVWIEKP